MRGFAVSEFVGPPYPVRVNRHVAQIATRTARWASELGLTPTADSALRLSRANAADLAGRACPDTDPDDLALLADLFSWLFTFDDGCDDDGVGADPARLAPVVARLLDVLDRLGAGPADGAVRAAGVAGVALHDLCTRVRAASRPGLLRFVDQMRTYLLAMLWEAANRQRGRTPGVSEYVQMRRHTGAVNPSFALTDLAHGVPTCGDPRDDPRFAALDLLAVDLVCWCNDIFSYDKERRLSQDGHNLTAAIARETGQDEQSALRAAVERFNAGLETYARLEAEVLASGLDHAVPFAAARRCWIRGTYDWSLGAARYE